MQLGQKWHAFWAWGHATMVILLDRWAGWHDTLMRKHRQRAKWLMRDK